jgi:hypothetical protein
MARDGHPDRELDPGVTAPFETQRGVIQDFVDGYLVPVDPMDHLHCESCQ